MSSPEQPNPSSIEPTVWTSHISIADNTRQRRNMFAFANGHLIPDVSSSTVFIDNETDHPCQHFANVECTSYADVQWNDIPTPALDSIIWTQYGDRMRDYNEIYEMFLVCIGRMLYPPGEYDNWKFMPFFFGRAGTGKSTIIRDVVGQFYYPSRTIMLNCQDPELSLKQKPDAFVTVMEDCYQGTYNPTRAQIAQMLDGPHWPTHIMAAGSEFPDQWKTSEMSRRVLLFHFDKPVRTRDPDLHAKLRTEMSAIIQKCSRVYRHKAMVHGDQDLWDFAPTYFKLASFRGR